ncbi:DEAD/DEAH box helicase [Sphaerochaeta sp. S2]|uniref:DEAD/DEAH box helicase n=1 Tax=Sphaerochaeta sp. S2 TaxID=2798868 RepID=UPI0018E9B07B|nr:DEAD/DEAH box helicase [Sphaerochaeta sp. S2]MBJ2355587.1 DEAD/DEAH box helicase [Sphaerochaeta sp. S2]
MSELLSFADLGLSAQTIAAVKSKGFEEPTKIQAACIPLLLKDQVDVIGQAQTGTGKTAAFGLPILEIVDPSVRQVQALILAPTRELAVQVAEEINSLKGDRHLEIAAVYGGASMDLQLRKLRRGVHVVVGTPGRILDHLRRGSLKLDQLKFVVLDEADEMLDMGFVEDIEEVLKQTPENKRMLCFSATMPAPIQRLAGRFMHEPQMVKIKQETPTSDLTDQIYVEVRESDKFEALTRIIDMEESFYGIVFCRTKVQCDEIGRKLMDRGYDAEPLHGDLSQKQRENILHKMRDRSISIIVATDVAARGIDISDLTHVINFSLPEDPEAYIHRIGRTGRAGKSGIAITFVGPREFRRFSFIQKVSKSEIRRESVPDANDIIETKRTRIISQLSAIATEEGQESPFLTIAEQLLEDKRPEEVVASLLDHFYKDELDVSKYQHISSGRNERGPREQRSEDNGFTRLFIARGRKDGLDKRRLVDYLIEQVGAEDRDIQNVTVRDDFSFVSAPLQVAERILQTFSSVGSEGKPIITRAKPDNPNGKHLSGRRGDRYDDRPSSPDRRSSGRRPRRSNDDYQPYGRDSYGGGDDYYSRPSNFQDDRSGRSHGKYSAPKGKKGSRPKKRYRD